MKNTNETNTVELKGFQKNMEAGVPAVNPAAAVQSGKPANNAAAHTKAQEALLKKKKSSEQLAEEAVAKGASADSSEVVSDSGAPLGHVDGMVIAQADTSVKAVESSASSAGTQTTAVTGTDTVTAIGNWASDVAGQISSLANQAWVKLTSLSTSEAVFLGVGVGTAGLVIAHNSSGNSVPATVEVPTLKTTQVTSSNADYNGKSTIDLTFDKNLDASHKPLTTSFEVKVNGNLVAIESVEISGDKLVLVLSNAVPSGALNLSVAYTDAAGNDINAIQDANGTDAASFEIETGVVADGYIRDARVFVDVNKDGAFNTGDVEIGKTDAKGRFYISKKAAQGGNIVVDGGVNIDTGVPNTMVLKAPASSLVINPLTTLVTAVMESSKVDATKATEQVANTLGLVDSDNKPLDLKNYDPIANNNVSAQKAAAQVASMVSLAGSSAGNAVISNLAKSVAEAVKTSTATVTTTIDLSSTEIVTKALTNVPVSDAVKTDIQSAVNGIKNAVDLEAITTAQAEALDSITPNAPTAVSVKQLTNDVTPTIQVKIEVAKTDGTAAVAGDTVTLVIGNVSQQHVLTEADIRNGYANIDLTHEQAEGSHTIAATVTDRAGHESQSSEATFTVDLTKPNAPTVNVLAQDDVINAAEKAGALTVSGATEAGSAVTVNGVQAKVDGTTWTYTFSKQDWKDGDNAIEVVATDAAGNASDKTVHAFRVDTGAPAFKSSSVAPQIDENSGAKQLVYSAQVDDAEATFSLINADDASAFSIDPKTGAVTLTSNPDFEAKTSYAFTVAATDAAGNTNEQSVSFSIGNLDEVAPTFTSASTASVQENVGKDKVVYTAASRDDGDTTAGQTVYSLKAGLQDDSALLGIDSQTGAVTLSVDPNFESGKTSYRFTVVATDKAGNAREQAVTLKVEDVNEAPVTKGTIPAVTGVTGQAFELLDVSSYFSDVDAGDWGKLTYSLEGDSALPAGLSLDHSTGRITGTVASSNQTGVAPITVIATDGGSLKVKQTFDFSVVSAPVIQGFTVADGVGSPSTGKQGDALTFTLTLSEAVTMTGSGTPTITFTAGGQDVVATYVSQGQDGNTWTFTGTAPSGNGTFSVKSIDLHGNVVTGNTSQKAFVTTAVGQGYAGYAVDNMAPAELSVMLDVDTGSSATDGKTSNAILKVLGMEAGASWEFSTDGGGKWNVGSGSTITTLKGDGEKSVIVRQTDVAGNVGNISTVLAFTLDTTDPTVAAMALASDTGVNGVDRITSNGAINVTLANDVDHWQYSIDNGANWANGTGTSFTLPAGSYAANAVQVKSIDLAGNSSIGNIAAATIVDTNAPSAATLSLTNDTGSSASDRVTSSGAVTVSLVSDADHWQYSIDNGQKWTTGTGSGFTLAAGTYEANAVQVQSFDLAGNSSIGKVNGAITVDATPPTVPTLALANDTGTSGSDGVTSNGAVNLTLAGDVDHWKYSIDNGAHWADGLGTIFTLPENSYAANAVQVKSFDLAGNSSLGLLAGLLTVDTTAPVAILTAASISSLGNAEVNSSEAGRAYLVNDSLTVKAVTDITAADETLWNSVSISEANSNVKLAALGLANGMYHLYTVDTAGNISSKSSGSVTVSAPKTNPINGVDGGEFTNNVGEIDNYSVNAANSLAMSIHGFESLDSLSITNTGGSASVEWDGGLIITVKAGFAEIAIDGFASGVDLTNIANVDQFNAQLNNLKAIVLL